MTRLGQMLLDEGMEKGMKKGMEQGLLLSKKTSGREPYRRP